jgi:hypothetical protein
MYIVKLCHFESLNQHKIEIKGWTLIWNFRFWYTSLTFEIEYCICTLIYLKKNFNWPTERIKMVIEGFGLVLAANWKYCVSLFDDLHLSIWCNPSYDHYVSVARILFIAIMEVYLLLTKMGKGIWVFQSIILVNLNWDHVNWISKRCQHEMPYWSLALDSIPGVF